VNDNYYLFVDSLATLDWPSWIFFSLSWLLWITEWFFNWLYNLLIGQFKG